VTNDDEEIIYQNDGDETNENESLDTNSEIARLTDLLQRVQADSVNYKKRMEEDKQLLREQSTRNLLLKLLPILDDFERATEHKPEHKDTEILSWIEGIELLQKNLKMVLDSIGLEKIEASEQEFNPMEHEAVLFQEVDNFDTETVIDVVREGYSFNNKTLRPSQVIVSKAKTDTENH
tara:strand:+ start:5205 stop:5738 length:534 start_codon:yes stop_codon:yes gene_type:complete